jgi:hypothetical protein
MTHQRNATHHTSTQAPTMGKYSTYLDLQHLCFAPAVELVVQHGEVGVGLGVRPPGHVSNPLLALSLYLLFPARIGRRRWRVRVCILRERE